MNKKIWAILAPLLAYSNLSYGVTLEEALAATYKNNGNLKANQQNFLREIEKFPQALASFLPDVSANISTGNSKQKADVANSVSQTSGHSISKKLTISQNIFAGGRSALGLKSAQAGFWVARSELYDSEQKILNSALEAYLTLCEHREKYKIAEDSLKFSMEQTKMAEEKRKVGEATVTEVELVKSNLANAEANKAAQYAKLLGAEANFKALTGLDPDDNIAFPELPKDLPENFESFQNQVLKSNLDLLRAKYSVKQTKAVAQSAAAGLLPTANVSLSAGKNLPSQDGLRPQANTMTYETSLGINIPIYSQGGQQYSAIREGKKQARRAVYSLDYAEKAIKAQTINVWQNFTATKSSIAFADQAVLSQSLALDGTRQEYNLGVKTTLDVLKTQEDFNKARTQAVDIKKSYVMNAYNMKQLMGHMTASQLKLPVKYFVPEQEFRRIKYKVIGF